MASRLADLYASCHSSFQALLSAVRSPKRDIGNQMSPRDVESELDKLILWANNVGAIYSGDSYEISLDYRLRKSTFYQERVVSFLNSLNQYLVRATQIAENETKPFEEMVDVDLSVEAIDSTKSSDTTSDPDSDTSEEQDEKATKRHSEGSDVSSSARSNNLELPKTLELIRFIINCLYKMPIRRPSALERITERISTQFAPYQQYDAQFVRDLHPEVDTTISTRLGRLVSLRRQILAYQEKHNQKLQPERTQHGLSSRPIVYVDPEAEAVVYTIPPSVQTSGISRPSKATTHQNPPDRPDLQKFDYPPSIASSHHSRASSYAINSIGLHIPPIPKDVDGTPLTNFHCPYCNIVQYIKTERSWKKHVLDDLQPYVCTFSGCSLQDHFFSSRNAWYLHETQEHRCVWHCNVEGHGIYKTQELFMDHMSQSHGTKLSREQMANLAPMFRRSDRSSSGECNMCFRKSKSLCDHVARHLERIALFALPRSVDDDADSKTSQELRSVEALLSDNNSLSASGKHEFSDEDSGLESTSQASGPDAGPASNVFEDGEKLLDVSDSLVPDSEEPDWDIVTTKFSQARKNDTAPDASPEGLLDRFFSKTDPDTEEVSFTETAVLQIAKLLELCSKREWSRIPRIYSVLRKIGRLDAVEGFIQETITDVWFPFNQRVLPRDFTGDADRQRFLEIQQRIFNSQVFKAERAQPEHGHFGHASDIPLKMIAELGKGGFGLVDCVVNTITEREYARKLIYRGRTFRKDKAVLRAFESELSIMRLVHQTHRHIVNLVGSYTDPKFVGIIMTPVADQTLGELLQRSKISADDRRFRSYFGCLVSVVCYLHDNRIRHKDLKPSKILLKDGEVYMTGFGGSLDWSDKSGDTTESEPSFFTPRYAPPEVIEYAPRNSSSDIWSLGCVYLEIWTVLRGGKISDLYAHMGSKQYHSANFDLQGWFTLMEALPGPPSDNLPIEWIRSMLQHDHKQRPTAHAIHGMIQEASAELDAEHMFIGQCCLDEDTESTYENAKSDVGDDQQDDFLSRIPSISIHSATHQEDRRLIRSKRRKSSV